MEEWLIDGEYWEEDFFWEIKDYDDAVEQWERSRDYGTEDHN